MDFRILFFVIGLIAYSIGFYFGSRGKKQLNDSLFAAYRHSQQQKTLIEELKKIAFSKKKHG